MDVNITIPCLLLTCTETSLWELYQETGSREIRGHMFHVWDRNREAPMISYRIWLWTRTESLACRGTGGRKEGRNNELGLSASVLALSHPRLCPGGKQNLTPRLCVFELHSYELYAEILPWSSMAFWWEGANQQKGSGICSQHSAAHRQHFATLPGVGTVVFHWKLPFLEY